MANGTNIRGLPAITDEDGKEAIEELEAGSVHTCNCGASASSESESFSAFQFPGGHTPYMYVLIYIIFIDKLCIVVKVTLFLAKSH